MLASLAIRDVVLIEKLDLSFDAGLAVLTGETGAGKSILLDSLVKELAAKGSLAVLRDGFKCVVRRSVWPTLRPTPAWTRRPPTATPTTD